MQEAWYDSWEWDYVCVSPTSVTPTFPHISFPFQSKPKDDAAIRKKTDAPSPDVKEEEEEEKEKEKPGDQSFVAEDEGEEVRAR